VAFRNAVIGYLGGYITHGDSAAGVDGSPLHLTKWWRLYGDSCPTLQVVATRLMSLACSSAGSERSFKTLGVVLSRTRNRTHDARVDRQWSVAFNSRQLNRVNAVSMSQRSRTEKEVVGLRVAVAAAIAGAGAGGAPAGGAPAAEGDDDGDNDDEGDEAGGSGDEGGALEAEDIEAWAVDGEVNILLAD